MIYLIVGEHCSGVMISQALDTCKYLSTLRGETVKVVAFISIRDFVRQRQKYKNHYPNSIILPMYPQLKNWRNNYFLLWLLKKILLSAHRSIMARGPIASLLALRLKQQRAIDFVTYDGRGAYAAEWNEFEVVPDEQMKKDIADFEKRVVLESDFRLAVSQKLVNYWQSNFQYQKTDHIVVPCTLSNTFNQSLPTTVDCLAIRKKYNYAPTDIIWVYAGSSAGWQSLQLLDQFLNKVLAAQPRAKVLFLSKLDKKELEIGKKYPERVQTAWVAAEEVFSILAACDYGLMMRMDAVTNQVAAPTKFAEYLAAGLPIVISENIGDYSELVKEEALGFSSVELDDEERLATLTPVSRERKEQLNAFARDRFSKPAYVDSYQRMLKAHGS